MGSSQRFHLNKFFISYEEFFQEFLQKKSNSQIQKMKIEEFQQLYIHLSVSQNHLARPKLLLNLKIINISKK